MLERATACLKSEAVRDSLRCAQQVSRSKRRLHSTFWSHGAGDLDLPPWALSTFPVPQGLPLKSNDTPRRRQRNERSTQAELSRDPIAVSDGLFLDFLYPPHALAWLQRANVPQWQRWERRNAIRLPEGFIVASRGYASRPRVQNLFTDAAARNEEEDERQDNVISGELDEKTRDWQNNGERYTQSPGKDTHDQEDQAQEHLRRLQDDEAEANPSQEYNPDCVTGGRPPSSFADSPADLDFLPQTSSGWASEHSPIDVTDGVSALKRLRELMGVNRPGHPKNSEAATLKAIAIYDSLGDEARNDVRLKRELLEWLSLQNNEAAQSYCVKTYKSIPAKDKTLQTYQAALAVLLDWRDYSAIDNLHEEALQNLENGYQISRTLFRHAVENQDWRLALRVERAHHERYLVADTNETNPSQASQIRVFWLHVSEIPGLLLKAVQLTKFLQSDDGSHLLDSHTRQFAATFFKTAISHEFLHRDSVHSFRGSPANLALPRRHIRRLFAHISVIEKDAPRLFHDVMLKMLRPNSGIKYSQLHHIVSFVYGRYRSLTDARPTEELLMLWLERLTEYSDNLSRVSSTSTSVSIQELVNEWKRHYGKISKDAVIRLMTFYARSGQLGSYEKWLEYFRLEYPNYEDQRDILWTMVWVHARRADLGAAQQAFAEVKRTTAEHGDEPDIRCWNLLLNAHSRADDLEGAFTNLQNMIDYSKLQPDKYSFHNVLQMLAKRGDVGGTEDLLEQFDRIVGGRRETAHLSSLILAHINNDDVQTAERVLREAIPQARDGEINGPLVGCFNLVMTACAIRRDIDATRRTYRWMKEEGVELDANSYAAIMQSLAFYRQTQQAYGILKRVMPARGIDATAFHYGIVIAGFLNNRQHNMAIEVYNMMVRMNVKPSVATHSAYLKAKAIAEHRRIGRWRTLNNEPIPLAETIQELKRVLRITDGSEIASKQPQLGFGSGMLSISEVPASYFDFLIFVHGQRRCFEAVQALYQQYKEDVYKRGKDQDTAPIRLLASFAGASWRYGNHEEVEKCWQLAKEQADDTSALIAVPQLKLRSSNEKLNNDVPEVEPPPSSPVVEHGIESHERPVNEETQYPAEYKQILLMDKQAPSPRPPAPARRHILTRVLRYYLLSLHSQGKTSEAIGTVTQVINQGYTMDNKTWNVFIESLCRTSPPLALLAFVLAERFLTPHFPGWSPTVEYPPRPEAVAQGLQYIKARYLAPGQLMPQYRTLVWMGAALIQLRKLLAQGGGHASFNLESKLEKYVGTLSLIRRYAPKTLFVVQTMPRVPDKLQSRLLNADGS